jgi:hypothetical protein
MLTLIVDFNAAQDGVVRGLREDVADSRELAEGRELVEGALVLLRDGEGNEALGLIQDASDDLVRAEVDWKTWGTEGAIRIVVDQPLTRGATRIVESISGPGLSHDRGAHGGLSVRLEGAEQQFALA